MALAPPPETQLVNEHQAARYLGLSVKTLRRWRWSGHSPAFYKLGSAVRYSLADLQELVACLASIDDRACFRVPGYSLRNFSHPSSTSS